MMLVGFFVGLIGWYAYFKEVKLSGSSFYTVYISFSKKKLFVFVKILVLRSCGATKR